ncbi:NAD(P)-binding domain-containing protein [Glycomyces harbinensis]|uniref:Pyrroline-5-carboxylate reductase n=1 Tax=Glycomyces harbinensis TaxID=58114 RepID=A0A1G6QSM3_9ACTN|nr:NAD(P)-binding domain-containing protein [Glycomyces harbinensis]SDC94696.1 pyrroline-5-carboxylate reductase [Glycomyces harbinensis]
MERIGIIGVGEIGKALVTGMCEGVADPPQVLLSPRGARTSAELAERYAGATVCADNQDVIERSDLVVIAVRPQDLTALEGLRVGPEKLVLNVMGGISNDDLRRTLGTDAEIVKAIPLPAVSERRSITVTYPSHPVVNRLFDALGGAQPLRDESELDILQALTATLSTHYHYLTALSSWAVKQGIAPEDADRFLRGLFQNLGRSLGDHDRSLQELATNHETPGGLNERIRTAWFDPNADALAESLDDLLASFDRD